MKGDFSRLLAPSLQSLGPLMQQGRVLLDADFNEYVAAAAELLSTIVADVVGGDGAPAAAPLTVGANDEGALTIAAGRYYAAGTVCVNPAAVPFASQPFLPGGELPSGDGTYSAVLRVWKRTVNWVQSPGIREVALGGLDTTVREQSVWQILVQSSDVPATIVPTMQARVAQPAAVGNYFYRVEIHGEGTFKWSRTNGSSIAKITALDATDDKTVVATVEGAGIDPSTLMTSGQWVEYVDDVVDLQQRIFPLWQVQSVESIDATTAAVTLGVPAANERRPFELSLHPFLRAWDQQQSATIPLDGGVVPITPNTWIALENGIEVCFPLGADIYQPADHWQFASRSALAQGIEWPVDANGNPLALPKFGIDFSTVPLATVTLDGGKWAASSLVKTFTPLLGATTGAPPQSSSDLAAEVAALRGRVDALSAELEALKTKRRR